MDLPRSRRAELPRAGLSGPGGLLFGRISAGGRARCWQCNRQQPGPQGPSRGPQLHRHPEAVRSGSEQETGSTVSVSRGTLQGTEIDLADAPDLFPIVAVVATQAKGVSTIFNAEHVRFKESDRIASTVKFLADMGASIEERKDGCIIHGPPD